MNSGFRPAVPLRQISFSVEAKIYEGLEKRAATMGKTAAVYARQLFDAAYTARVFRERGQTPDDAEMDRQVVTIFALADCEPEFIAAATGFPEATVRRVIEGFSIVARERASISASRGAPAAVPPAAPAGPGKGPDGRSALPAGRREETDQNLRPATRDTGGRETAPEAGSAASGAPGSGTYWNDAQTRIVAEMWAKGATVREIAICIGRTQAATQQWICNHRDICPRRK